MEELLDNNQENKSKEEMVKEAMDDAKKAAAEAEKAEPAEDSTEEAVREDEKDQQNAEDSEGTGDSEGTEDAEVTEPTEPSAAKEDVKADKKEKKFGRKIKKDKKDEKIEELTDRLTRQIAEFDNFRKRTDKEKSQMYEIGAKDVIEKILQVVDNFERGLSAATEEEKESPVMQGMDKVYKQLMTMLEEIGVKPIEAAGKEFNPDLHNAVMHIEDEAFDENTVAEEFQKGYMYRESVVRHSMVKVAN